MRSGLGRTATSGQNMVRTAHAPPGGPAIRPGEPHNRHNTTGTTRPRGGAMSFPTRTRAARRLIAVAACSALALPAMAAMAAGAGAHEIPVIHPKLFAPAPTGATKPDDITRLGGTLYVTYQNNAG